MTTLPLEIAGWFVADGWAAFAAGSVFTALTGAVVWAALPR